jgi:hypothetical protein
MLLPATPSTDFAVVAVVFVSATLLGFISHAPGSLGIFEATTLIALPQFQMEELLASLLIFRVLYFVAPFAVAVLMLGVRELWLARIRFRGSDDATRAKNLHPAVVHTSSLPANAAAPMRLTPAVPATSAGELTKTWS